MIISFSVQNFGSIKNKQTLSFEADKSSKHLEDYYIIKEGKFRLLKLALIYGANASGKTTILKALEFLAIMILNPAEKKTETFDFNPFLFDAKTPKQNSILSMDFIQNKIRYIYEVEFNKNAILREELTHFKPSRANVFKRTTDIKKQLSKITFGSKIKINPTLKKTLEANTLWNSTVLGGFLKTNIEIKELKEVIDWFGNYLRRVVYTHSDLNDFVTSKINDSDINKDVVVNILKKADFHISDILIQKEEREISLDVIEFFEKQFKKPNKKLEELKNTRTVPGYKLEFEHTVHDNKYTLPFELESQGTNRFYGFAGLLSRLITNSISSFIDELESSLHPDLYIHFLLSFLVNAKRSQIIATTHNREILDNKDIFRNDAIWFTDKAEDCGTELYSLANFDSTVVRDTSNILNAYKAGKLGGKPNLGDYYIDIENE